MSQIRDTIKNKNKIEKARRARRKNEISTLRSKSIYKATLYDELKHVEIILQDPDINAVIIDIPESSMPQFSNAIYSEDLAGYEIEQLPGESNKFYIRRKFISF